MRPVAKIAASLLAATMIPAATLAATLGGVDYATQYDYREFYAATDNKPFRVVLVGNPFPSLPPEEVARVLLPQMQANKPPPNLAFTYERPAEPPRPDYRLMLVFNPALNLGADPVCEGVSRHAAGPAEGRVYVFAVYCRNDRAMSQVTGWTYAARPDDPGMGSLFKDAFAVLFNRSPAIRPQSGPIFR